MSKEEPAEIKERNDQYQEQALTGISQAFGMINKTTRTFISAKMKTGTTEAEAMQMAHSATIHSLANMMAYGFVHKQIPDLQASLNLTANILAESIIAILKQNGVEGKEDSGIILP